MLEPALKSAVYSSDYKQAKLFAADIQGILRATDHETRLMQSKNWLFEAALNAGELLIAEAGFRGVCAKTAKTTKVHLEASALLVVCLLRQQKITEAEPLIAKVLQGKSIKDAERRRHFIESVTARYQLELGFASRCANLQAACTYGFGRCKCQWSRAVQLFCCACRPAVQSPGAVFGSPYSAQTPSTFSKACPYRAHCAYGVRELAPAFTLEAARAEALHGSKLPR